MRHVRAGEEPCELCKWRRSEALSRGVARERPTQSTVRLVRRKRKVAPQVWSALGDVDNYVEPFAGSLCCTTRTPGVAR